MKPRALVVVAFAALSAVVVVSTLAKSPSSPLKMKIVRPKVAVAADSSVDVTVTVRNKSSDPFTGSLDMYFDDSGPTFDSETLSFAGGETKGVVVTVPVPVGAAGTKLAVVARAGDAGARAFLKIGGAPVAGGNAVNGGILFQANCASCHGGKNFGSKTPEKLLSAFASGPGSMPTFPALTRQDALDIIAYCAGL